MPKTGHMKYKERKKDLVGIESMDEILQQVMVVRCNHTQMRQKPYQISTKTTNNYPYVYAWLFENQCIDGSQIVAPSHFEGKYGFDTLCVKVSRL